MPKSKSSVTPKQKASIAVFKDSFPEASYENIGKAIKKCRQTTKKYELEGKVILLEHKLANEKQKNIELTQEIDQLQIEQNNTQLLAEPDCIEFEDYDPDAKSFFDNI